MTFEEFKSELSKQCEKKFGISLECLADCPTRDWYDEYDIEDFEDVSDFQEEMDDFLEFIAEDNGYEDELEDDEELDE